MKYLEGNIFINFYIFGLAGIISVIVGGIILKIYGLKITYYISFIMGSIGCIGMIIIQGHVLNFNTVAQKEAFDEQCMPLLILILKMGVIMSFITTTQISFTDDRIFPPNRRNTSVGTCGMIARSITIVAPIINEWTAPYPIIVMLVFNILGFITSTQFPNTDDKIL